VHGDKQAFREFREFRESREFREFREFREYIDQATLANSLLSSNVKHKCSVIH
jgi:hypothetical protein